MNRRYLKKKLLSWHNAKAKRPDVVDLLESDYQRFRYRVMNRLGVRNLSFKEALKSANLEELEMLEEIKNERRLGI